MNISGVRPISFNENWREYAETNEPEFYERLGECRNKPLDVVLMANLMHRYNPNKTAEECFGHALEWVGDWNGQYNITEKIYSNYEWYLSRVH